MQGSVVHDVPNKKQRAVEDAGHYNSGMALSVHLHFFRINAIIISWNNVKEN